MESIAAGKALDWLRNRTQLSTAYARGVASRSGTRRRRSTKVDEHLRVRAIEQRNYRVCASAFAVHVAACAQIEHGPVRLGRNGQEPGASCYLA